MREALLGLATVVRVTDFEEETENARQLMEKYPLQGLFGGVTMDHSGRVVARNFNYGRKPEGSCPGTWCKSVALYAAPGG